MNIETIKDPEGEPEGYYYNIMECGSALHGDGPFDSHESALKAGQEYRCNHRKEEQVAYPLNWGKVATSCGVVWHSDYKENYTLEMNLKKTSLMITHDDYDGEMFFKVFPEGIELEICTGQDFCEDWNDNDFTVIESSIRNVPLSQD